MAENVIILGAGASTGYGVPVMGNFLDVARELYTSGKTGKHRDSFERVFATLSRLQAVHSKSEFDLVNLESIFTAFELAKTLGRFPGTEAEDIDQLIDDLKWVIVSTIQETLRFPVSRTTITGHLEICKFVEHIVGRERQGNREDTAILTFNYDLLFDMALHSCGIGVDYGITKQLDRGWCIPLLKLHGSLNWATDRESEKVVPWFLRTRTRITWGNLSAVGGDSVAEETARTHNSATESPPTNLHYRITPSYSCTSS